MPKTGIYQRFNLMLLTGLLLSVCVNPAWAGDISLRQAVIDGLESNPSYSAAVNNKLATDQVYEEAFANYLPRVDLRADAGVEYSNDPITRSSTTAEDEEALARYDSSMTVSQLIFDGFETPSQVNRQTANVNAAQHRVKEAAEFVSLDIVQAYLDVLRQRELLTIARRNVSQHRSMERKVADNVRAGRSTRGDLSQIRGRLAQAEAAESNIKQNLRNAESVYRREVGKAPGDLAEPLSPHGFVPKDVDEIVKSAVAHNPTVRAFMADSEAAEANIDVARASFYPQFNAELTARRSHDVSAIQGRDESATALVVMNWNLFRGGADTARAEQFTYRYAESLDRYRDAARQVEDDVRQTWSRMLAARDRYKLFSAQAKDNINVVATYTDQFDLGRRTLLDVLIAQNELFAARSSAITAKFLEILAQYRLLALQGNLLETLKVENPMAKIVKK